MKNYSSQKQYSDEDGMPVEQLNAAETSGASPPLADDILSTKEAAAFLKIAEGSLRNLCSNGKVPFYKWFGSNRYLKSELISLLLSKPMGVRK